MVSLIAKIKSNIQQLSLQKNVKPCQFGDKVLRQVSQEVPIDLINTEEFKLLTTHMHNIMERYNGQGLAAPQIGINLQVVTIQFTEKDMEMALLNYGDKGVKLRQMRLIPFQVLINPKLCVTDFKTVVFEEGCLSLGKQTGFVPRYKEVVVEAINSCGENVKFKADGWYARILQHELHHLKGLLIVDCFVNEPKRFFKF